MSLGIWEGKFQGRKLEDVKARLPGLGNLGQVGASKRRTSRKAPVQVLDRKVSGFKPGKLTPQSSVRRGIVSSFI